MRRCLRFVGWLGEHWVGFCWLLDVVGLAWLRLVEVAAEILLHRSFLCFQGPSMPALHAVSKIPVTSTATQVLH